VEKGKGKAQAKSSSRNGSAVKIANAEVKVSFDRLKDQLRRSRWYIAIFIVTSTVWLGLRTPPAAEMTQQALDLCRADLACWVIRNGAKAEAGCRHVVEAAAKNRAIWDEDSFGRVRTAWFNQEEGSLMLSGDSVRFEDDRGDLVRMSFTCLFDAASSRVRLQRVVETK